MSEYEPRNMTATEVKMRHDHRQKEFQTRLNEHQRLWQQEMYKTMKDNLLLGRKANLVVIDDPIMREEPGLTLSMRKGRFAWNFALAYKDISIRDGGVGEFFLHNWRQRIQTEKFGSVSLRSSTC